MVKGNGNSSGRLPRLMSMSQAKPSRKTGASNKPAVSREEMSSAPLRSSLPPSLPFFFEHPHPKHIHSNDTAFYQDDGDATSKDFPTALFQMISSSVCRVEILPRTSVTKTTKRQWTRYNSFGLVILPPARPPPFAGGFLSSPWYFLLSESYGSLETQRLCDYCKVLLLLLTDAAVIHLIISSRNLLTSLRSKQAGNRRS